MPACRTSDIAEMIPGVGGFVRGARMANEAADFLQNLKAGGGAASPVKGKAKGKPDVSLYEAEPLTPEAKESQTPEVEPEDLTAILDRLKGKLAPSAAPVDVPPPAAPAVVAPVEAAAAPVSSPLERLQAVVSKPIAMPKAPEARSAAQDFATAKWLKAGKPERTDGPRGRQRAAAPFQTPLEPRGTTAKGNLAFTAAEKDELLKMPLDIFDAVTEGKMSMAEARAALASAAE